MTKLTTETAFWVSMMYFELLDNNLNGINIFIDGRYDDNVITKASTYLHLENKFSSSIISG